METHKHFCRLFGDINGDRTVNSTDVANASANRGKSGSNLHSDVNGDGVVNTADLNFVKVQLGKSLNGALPLDD